MENLSNFQNSWRILQPEGKLNDLGREIRRLRQFAGLSQLDLARRVGVDASYISMIETGRQPDPGRDMLKALARELSAPIETLLKLAGYLPTAGQQPEAPRPRDWEQILREAAINQPKWVPVIEQRVSAGGGTVVTPEVVPYFPDPAKRNHEHFAVVVSGKCLEPAILEGHMVIVDKDESYRPGDYVVAIIDDEALVKILAKRNGNLVLTDYAGKITIPVTSETRILGVVVDVRYKPPQPPAL